MKRNASLSEFKGELILLIAATIWGISFVSQRQGMESLGPFSFNSIRFLLGGLSLMLPAFLLRRSSRARGVEPAPLGPTVRAGILTGLILTCGASCQQIGIVSTTAGNAGFLTGLYVVLVPLVGIFLGKRIGPSVWLGAALAFAGLYLLSVKAGFRIGTGDLIVLAGAPFWTAHILVIDRFTAKVDGLAFCITQFFTCALLSAVPALAFEAPSLAAVQAAAIPLAYSAFLSIGVGYTLQIFGQRSAHPARAAIIMCMESPLAAISGIFFLGEPFTARIAVGAALMLGGMILAQVDVPGLAASVSGKTAERATEAPVPASAEESER